MECGKPFAIVENMTLAVKSRAPTETSYSSQNTQRGTFHAEVLMRLQYDEFKVKKGEM